MSGIYIHIPFCKQACYYCDFHFSTQLKNEELLVDAICAEIELRQDYLGGRDLNTLYFGGGTPSIIQNKNLNRIFNQARKIFDLNDNAEITLEANPDDITEEKLDQWKEMGINRLSIGIQSFRNEDLIFMNRVHNAEESLKCVQLASDCGFKNISIDLIYGIPELNIDAWKKNLEIAIDLDVQHISAYCLTIEPRTVFGNRLKKGQLVPTSDEEIELQFKMLKDLLESAGFDHYEISNFSKPGYISQHNSNYWKGEFFLGVGPSAHSFNITSRRWNVSNNHLYIKALEKDDPFSEQEEISLQKAYNEYVLTRLRTKWGIDLKHVKDQFKIDIQDLFKKELDLHTGHLDFENHHLKLNESGLMLADRIASDLFLT